MTFQTASQTTLAGRSLVHITCDRCSCEYFYELARIGTATDFAYFASNARKLSEDGANRDLNLRLTTEAELVPCPQCHWINEKLVEGYRLSRFREIGFWNWGGGIGVFGTIICLVLAWKTYLDPLPGEDVSAVLPYFLFVGPIGFISLTVILLLIQRYGRSLIQPNKEFPMPPRIPVGTPPALVLNATGDQLVRAKNADAALNYPTEWLNYQFGRHAFPSQCCVCLGNASHKHAYTKSIIPTLILEVPRCSRCAFKNMISYGIAWSISLAIASLLSIGLMRVLNGPQTEFSLLWIPVIIVALAFSHGVASIFTRPLKFRKSDLSRGILSLKFANADYHKIVAEHFFDVE